MHNFILMVWDICHQIINVYIPQVSSIIREYPLLLFTVGIFALGGVIGVFGRMLSKD